MNIGFITYSNQAKVELLGVKKSTLDTYGAVSEQTALEMVTDITIQNPERKDT
jgi:nicotinamide-nucleotide amidase